MARNAGVPGAGAKMWNDNKRYSAPPPRNWPWQKKKKLRTLPKSTFGTGTNAYPVKC